MASDDGERYRYRQLGRIRLRDDGYRIHFQLAGALNVDPDEWTLWAEYKQCDLPGPSAEIADVLMGVTMPTFADLSQAIAGGPNAPIIAQATNRILSALRAGLAPRIDLTGTGGWVSVCEEARGPDHADTEFVVRIVLRGLEIGSVAGGREVSDAVPGCGPRGRAGGLVGCSEGRDLRDPKCPKPST